MRQFTQDDNQFKDGIISFDKRKDANLHKLHETSEDKRLYGYLLLDFKMPRDIIFKDFMILESIEVDIGLPNKKAYVSPVKMPQRINHINSHYFTLGLSAICSFAFERPVLATKNDNFNRFIIANELELKEIGVEFPRTIAGPGAKGFRIHLDIIDLWETRLKDIINLLDILTDKENTEYRFTFEDIMQSFRLIQLAYINKKEDFDLGYSFLIAGIEAISQLAIDRITFLEKHEMYEKWKKHSKTDDIGKSLFEEYLKIKTYVDSEIKNRDLTKRFTKFLILYNNKTNWEEVFYDDLISEGLAYRSLYPNEISIIPELSPTKLIEEEFSDIIKKTYQLRSKFFHTGKPLPHNKTNNSSSNRYFEIINNAEKREILSKLMIKKNTNEISYTELSKTQDIVITFELMSSMARNSITSYIKSEIQKQ
ncbi:hypothetical protein [Flavobacterium soli]|uniref:hypothetical protein n=1 Tax=Flavobacterium soli TaxID=344881 RepID=UPI0004186594|nr:hypothetical protein [Flavobacterium soli]